MRIELIRYDIFFPIGITLAILDDASGIPLIRQLESSIQESMDTRYRLILFDADGTLFDYEKAEDTALEAALGEEGVPYRREEHRDVYRAINQELWELFEKGGIQAAELRVERFKRFSLATGIPLDPVSISRRYLKHLAEGAYLYEGVECLLQELKRKYKIGLVTNGLKEVQRNRFAKTPLPQYMSCIIVSDEVGLQKPDPAIFRMALMEAGESDPRRTLVVGDSLTSDIQGGWNAGMDTCWFNPTGKMNQTSLAPTYEIRQLKELLEFL
ncbi:MAG: YjjG family noncanonical pyrimidine nucleotidase [Spirochaetes bacterium]|nr:YjjG family noncanonical pyrimidine nucleotidase [Spirochaetota bacterium]